jgi:Tol biopolymer transport system component
LANVPSVRSGVSKRQLPFAFGVLALATVAIAVGWYLVDRPESTGSTGTGSTFVTFSQTSNIVVLELATGRTRLVTHADGRYLAVSSPTWSPGGRRIAFARQTCPHCSFRIAIAALGTSSTDSLRGWRRDANEPTWSPDGRRLVFTTSHDEIRELALFEVREGRGRVLGIHREAGEGGEEDEVESPNHPAFSPDSRTVAFEAETARERTRINLLDLTSGELRELENEADHNASPAFSPTGRQLVFSQTDARFVWDVCTVQLDSGDQVCLTRGPANEVDPSWSPDGRSIIFAGDQADPQHLIRSLYIMRPDGTGLRRITDGFDDGAPAFSPDGTEVAFVRREIHRIRR